MEKQIYTPPRIVTDRRECVFYHEMDLPGYGHICDPTTRWDLRGREREYLGGVEFTGKRTLDVGTASGYLSFFVESQGARVVSLDLSEKESWDFVPYQRFDTKQLGELFSNRKERVRKLNNAYWLAHRVLHSNAKMVHSTVYSIPEKIGPVDITMISSVLLHVRDPFLALQSALRITKETVIVTEPDDAAFRSAGDYGTDSKESKLEGPTMRLLPPRPDHSDLFTWWQLTPELAQRFLKVLGFEGTKVSYHQQRRCSRENHREAGFYTVVGRRTHGFVCSGVPSGKTKHTKRAVISID